MPITKQAIKKMHRDSVRMLQNKRELTNVKNLVKTMHLSPTKKALTTAYKALDKAAKKNIIHSNKAARLKSRLANLLHDK